MVGIIEVKREVVIVSPNLSRRKGKQMERMVTHVELPDLEIIDMKIG